ncbi:Sensory neuron membrane protein 1 [Bienertia sinuspersici]
MTTQELTVKENLSNALVVRKWDIVSLNVISRRMETSKDKEEETTLQVTMPKEMLSEAKLHKVVPTIPHIPQTTIAGRDPEATKEGYT